MRSFYSVLWFVAVAALVESVGAFDFFRPYAIVQTKNHVSYSSRISLQIRNAPRQGRQKPIMYNAHSDKSNAELIEMIESLQMKVNRQVEDLELLKGRRWVNLQSINYHFVSLPNTSTSSISHHNRCMLLETLYNDSISRNARDT